MTLARECVECNRYNILWSICLALLMMLRLFSEDEYLAHISGERNCIVLTENTPVDPSKGIVNDLAWAWASWVISYLSPYFVNNLIRLNIFHRRSKKHCNISKFFFGFENAGSANGWTKQPNYTYMHASETVNWESNKNLCTQSIITAIKLFSSDAAETSELNNYMTFNFFITIRLSLVSQSILIRSKNETFYFHIMLWYCSCLHQWSSFSTVFERRVSLPRRYASYLRIAWFFPRNIFK